MHHFISWLCETLVYVIMGLYKDLSEYLILIGPRVGIKGTPPPVWPDSNAIMLHCPKKSCILLLIIVWWWRCLIEATSIQNLWTKKNNKKKNMGNPVELCEPRSEVEWVGVNQGENLCLCMCVHTCICLEKEWRMWCNICEMFFQTSSTSQRRLSLIFNLNPPPPTPPPSLLWLQLWWHSMKRLHCCSLFTSREWRMSE